MKLSNNDNRQYQLLTLDNGLRILLINDDSTAKCAVSLTVNVGHFDDPENRQGMAHFLEHMLFLGTVEHPILAGFRSLLVNMVARVTPGLAPSTQAIILTVTPND